MTREKYMPEEKRESLAETDSWTYYNQEGWFEKLLNSKGAFYNRSSSADSDNDDENYNKNNEQQQLS